MPNIYAGLIFYNDTPDLLQKSLVALKDSGLQVIAIDGAYREFMDQDRTGQAKWYSTDGCIDVARAQASLYIPAPPWGWTDQAHKRSEYMQLIPDGDFVLIMDGDEILHKCEIDPGKFTDDVYALNMYRADGEFAYKSIRIYRIYPDLKYQYQHCRIYRMRMHDPKYIQSGCVTKAQGGLNALRKVAMDAKGEPIAFTHHPEWRPQDRQDQKARYKQQRKEREYFDHILKEKKGQ